MTTRHTEADARIAIDDRLRQAGWDPLDKSMVGTEIQAADSLATDPVVSRFRARPFETHAPVYDQKAAAGAFGPDRVVGALGDEIGWAPVPESVRLTRDHFVARVNGQSMEPTIPDGSHCLFRTERGGSRQGKLVLVWQRGAADPAEGRAATGRVWFYEIRNDGYDPDRIQGGGRPETPKKNDIPGLMAAWSEYKVSGYRDPPGVEAGAVLDAGSDEPRCWWAPFDAIAGNDYNLTASRYKPRVAEAVPDEDPADLIREVLAIEHEITTGLEKLLEEVL